MFQYGQANRFAHELYENWKMKITFFHTNVVVQRFAKLIQFSSDEKLDICWVICR